MRFARCPATLTVYVPAGNPTENRPRVSAWKYRSNGAPEAVTPVADSRARPYGWGVPGPKKSTKITKPETATGAVDPPPRVVFRESDHAKIASATSTTTTPPTAAACGALMRNG